MVPNGSGDDLAASFSIDSAHTALQFIIKGQGVKFDVVDMVADAEKREDVPDGEKIKRCRYMMINSGVGFVANVNVSA